MGRRHKSDPARYRLAWAAEQSVSSLLLQRDQFRELIEVASYDNLSSRKVSEEFLNTAVNVENE